MGKLQLSIGPCADHFFILSISAPCAPVPYAFLTLEARIAAKKPVPALGLAERYPDEVDLLRALQSLLSGSEGRWNYNYIGTYPDERGLTIDIALPLVNVPQLRCSEPGCHGVICANHFFFPAKRAGGVWDISFYCPVPGCGAVYYPDGKPKSFTDGLRAYLVALKGPNGVPQIRQVAIQAA